jgi:hypothetical protein
MSDRTESVLLKSENSFAAGHLPKPKVEFPANLREFAEEAMAQTRGNYERIETMANEMVSLLASTQSTATKSIVNYRTWMIKVAHGNHRRLRFCRRLEQGKVGVGRYGARERARARSIRCSRRPDQGAERALTYLRDRDSKADQREHRQCAQGRCVISGFKNAPKRSWLFSRARKSVLKMLERAALDCRTPQWP